MRQPDADLFLAAVAGILAFAIIIAFLSIALKFAYRSAAVGVVHGALDGRFLGDSRRWQDC